ncbi:MAG TPA: alpha/beta hydrolase [Thermoguttaceae bacterium]|nr:alpha/beta hydrolase [Thermoguttaceae bacterium]
MRTSRLLLAAAVIVSLPAFAGAAPSAPEGVKVVRDIVYAKYGDRDVMLDLYLPEKIDKKPIACIVVIHGGGWRSGNKERFARFAADLAEHGYAAACIGYRLLPEVTFPAPIVDCKAAVRWVRANAEKYSIDPDRIGAIGGSAGAHLVAMLGTSHQVAELEGDGGQPGVSSRIHAVVALATPADLTRYGQRIGMAKKMIQLTSPITHVDDQSAPILLIHSDDDPVVPYQMSVDLKAKYEAKGVRAELVTIERGGHAFWNSQKWFPDTMTRAKKFFDEVLGDPTGTNSPSD